MFICDADLIRPIIEQSGRRQNTKGAHMTGMGYETMDRRMILAPANPRARISKHTHGGWVLDVQTGQSTMARLTLCGGDRVFQSVDDAAEIAGSLGAIVDTIAPYPDN